MCVYVCVHSGVCIVHFHACDVCVVCERQRRIKGSGPAI